MKMLIFVLVVTSLRLTSASDITDRFQNIMDILFECPAGCEVNKLSENNPVKILSDLDCVSSSARWDFQISKISGSCNPKQALNGICKVAFNFASEETKVKNVFKAKRCFNPFRENVKEIIGKFVNNTLQGSVKIKHHDGSTEVGQAIDGSFSGARRFFDKSGNFQNASTTNGNLYLRQVTFGFILDIGLDQKLLMPKNLDRIFVCKTSKSKTFYETCFDVDESMIDISGCDIKVNIESFEQLPARDESLLFKYRESTDEVVYPSKDQYPYCKFSQTWTKENIRQDFQDWLQKVSDAKTVFWLQPEYEEPLDLKNPVLEISILPLVNRTQISTFATIIRGWHGELLLGTIPLISGRFQVQVPSDYVTHSAWHDPITVEVYNNIDVAFNPDRPSKAPYISVQGRLKSGKLNGLVIIKGRMTNDPHSSCFSTSFEGIGFVGFYEDGRPVGTAWKGLFGAVGNGAWIYGEVDSQGTFTGHQVAYIYPDWRTAYLGKFENGLMVAGRLADIIGSRCDERGIKLLEFSQPSGNSFKYQPPDHASFGDQPMITDILDDRYVEVRPSEAFPDAGDGLFAKVDIPASTIFSLFSGMALTSEQKKMKTDELKRWALEQNLDNEIVVHWKYRIQVPYCDIHVEIPHEFESTSKFNATLGHKANHSFQPNAANAFLDTARFGPMPALLSLRAIKPGEEIFTFYHYKKGQPEWYKKLQEQHEAKENKAR